MDPYCQKYQEEMKDYAMPILEAVEQSSKSSLPSISELNTKGNTHDLNNDKPYEGDLQILNGK